MRALGVIGGVAMTAATVMGSVGAAPPAAAAFDVALTGTYSVLSDGEYAKTNDVFMDEPTVAETWNANTTCISPIECSGTITSDKGPPLAARLDDFWYVSRDIPNWAPCPDGSFAMGHQTFILLGWDRFTEQRVLNTRDFFIGRNVTKTDSGACGRNQPLVIEIPVSVKRIS